MKYYMTYDQQEEAMDLIQNALEFYCGDKETMDHYFDRNEDDYQDVIETAFTLIGQAGNSPNIKYI